MENSHLPIYPFMGQYPFFLYHSWTHPTYLCPPPAPQPVKQSQTRESLGWGAGSADQLAGRIVQNETKTKPLKSKRTIVKEKMMKRREREDNYERKKQKKDRNLPSNIFKNLANFFYLNPNINLFITKLIPSGLNVSASELVNKFKQAIKFGQSYIRPLIVQSLCKEGLLTSQEATVFRIVMRRFLLLEMPLLIMSQPKLKRKQRGQYIKMGRKLFGQLNKGVFQ